MPIRTPEERKARQEQINAITPKYKPVLMNSNEGLLFELLYREIASKVNAIISDNPTGVVIEVLMLPPDQTIHVFQEIGRALQNKLEQIATCYKIATDEATNEKSAKPAEGGESC